METKKKLVIFLSIMVFIGVTACSKEDDDSGSGNSSVINAKVENGNEYDDWIVTVKALIAENEGYYPGGGFYWIGYELASGEYKNGGFKLNLPANVPEQYLSESMEDIDFASDKNAKGVHIHVLAYNEQGREIGEFKLIGTTNNTEVEAWYFYIDRNVTAKGTEEDSKYKNKYVYNISYRKGWNISYITEGYTDKEFVYTNTTSKPEGVDFKWRFRKN